MAGRLEQIEDLLKAQLGGAFLSAHPDMPYQVHRILLGLVTKNASMSVLWEETDSYLFNTLYESTGGKMLLLTNRGRIRMTQSGITDLADHLVSLLYLGQSGTPDLQAQLYDLSRCGSFCAMRELLAHYPLSPEEQEIFHRILSENNAL